MKALSIRAPWWWAILYLGKRIENRDWSTNYRGRIYLHASKWFSIDEIMYDIEDVREMRLKASPDLVPPHCTLRMLKDAGGCFVGTVDIVDCVTASSSPWFVGKYGFVLENPIPLLRPIPYRGERGLFDVPDSLLAA